MQKQAELYRGKSKTVYTTDDTDLLLMHFRDDATAFNAKKHAQLDSKGRVNNCFNTFIMQHLQQAGIATGFVSQINENDALVKNLKMIPLECVVRNMAAGSICRRFGVEEGMALNPSVFEFFLKNNELDDPFINESHIQTFSWASDADVKAMRETTLKINDILQPLFLKAGMLLVDFKLEFGYHQGELLLGDEFTPDGCRIWDAQTREKLDKDRFRQDLGDVIESYVVAAQRLGIRV